MPALQPGARVRFAVESLGAVREVHPYQFVERTFGRGETGVVSGPIRAMDDWFYVTPDDDDTLLVPVHPYHVEVIA